MSAQQIAIDIYKAALLAAWPLAIISILAMGIVYYISHELKKNREELRALRVSLERNPSPAQIGAGMRMFPDAVKFPENLRIQEMVKRAAQDESKRAERIEVIMSYVRFIGILTFIGVGLIVAGFFYHPG